MDNRMSLVTGFILMMSIFSSALALGNQIPYSKANIYYCDWSLTTRIAWSPKQVRDSAKAVITVEGSEIKPLLQLLHVLELTDKTDNKGDARVVVDLYRLNGSIDTYYSDMFRLYNSDGSLSRKIDERFRKDLSDYIKSQFETR